MSAFDFSLFFFFTSGNSLFEKINQALSFPSAEYVCLLNIFPGSHQLVDHFQAATGTVTAAAGEDVEDSIATPSVVHRAFPLRESWEVLVIIRQVACWDPKLIDGAGFLHQ